VHLAQKGLAQPGLQSVLVQNASGTTRAKDPKLERSAHEFEASLMAELLKPLQENDGLTGEDSDGSGAGSGGALAGFASESLARAISERGGFGIADRILSQLESHGPGAPKKEKGNPVQAPLKVSGSRPI
jgi:Rod binding domain-containing protein